MDWHGYKRQLPVRVESSLHPHAEDEHAEWFLGVTYEATEIEYLDLLHCLVLARKPLTLLETGTNLGLSALAIAFALRENHVRTGYMGMLYSVESDPNLAHAAELKIADAGLADYVAIEIADSVDFIRRTDCPQFEWVFFDSSRRVRPNEFRTLVTNRRLASGAMLAFHDTSAMRAQSMPHQEVDQREYLAALDDIAVECRGRLTFPLSRGLWLLQWDEESRS